MKSKAKNYLRKRGRNACLPSLTSGSLTTPRLASMWLSAHHADQARQYNGMAMGQKQVLFQHLHLHLQRPKQPERFEWNRLEVWSLCLKKASTSIQRPGSISQMSHWHLRWCHSSVHPWHHLLGIPCWELSGKMNTVTRTCIHMMLARDAAQARH